VGRELGDPDLWQARRRAGRHFLTIDHGVQLADEIAATGKNLTYIHITHGHGDHFFSSTRSSSGSRT
jgi:glyoxylase-like metal-dependent hydrolase (beta-lactamase superfamily II)